MKYRVDKLPSPALELSSAEEASALFVKKTTARLDAMMLATMKLRKAPVADEPGKVEATMKLRKAPVARLVRSHRSLKRKKKARRFICTV